MISRIFIPVVFVAALAGCSSNNTPGAQDHPTTALGDSSEPIKEQPFSADTHYAAGLLAETHGDYKAAISHYDATLRVEKDSPRALYRLGCIYALLKDYPTSIKQWKKYLAATDNSAAGYNNLAYTEELFGQPADAEMHYKMGLTADPKNEPCRINYGLMLARHNRMAEAILQLQAVLPAAHVHYDLAEVYELQHRPEMAKLEYRQALSLDPNFNDAKTKLTSLGEFGEED